MSNSFGKTMSSSGNYQSTIAPLKMLLNQLPPPEFPIHGHLRKKPINEVENSYQKSNVDLQKQIKSLLDQRKPPTEELVSLCDLYDDNLNLVEN